MKAGKTTQAVETELLGENNQRDFPGNFGLAVRPGGLSEPSRYGNGKRVDALEILVIADERRADGESCRRYP